MLGTGRACRRRVRERARCGRRSGRPVSIVAAQSRSSRPRRGLFGGGGCRDRALRHVCLWTQRRSGSETVGVERGFGMSDLRSCSIVGDPSLRGQVAAAVGCSDLEDVEDLQRRGWALIRLLGRGRERPLSTAFGVRRNARYRHAVVVLAMLALSSLLSACGDDTEGPRTGATGRRRNLRRASPSRRTGGRVSDRRAVALGRDLAVGAWTQHLGRPGLGRPGLHDGPVVGLHHDAALRFPTGPGHLWNGRCGEDVQRRGSPGATRLGLQLQGLPRPTAHRPVLGRHLRHDREPPRRGGAHHWRGGASRTRSPTRQMTGTNWT